MKYCVTITRAGWFLVEANSVEEAMDIADRQTTDTINWLDDWDIYSVIEDDSAPDELE